MKVTIQDVAKKAGVATSTVSRALNNKGRISEETKNKIIEIADSLNYQPRKYEQKDVGQETLVNNVAILYNKKNSMNQTNEFYSHIIEGVEQVFKEREIELFFKTLEGEAEDVEMINNLLENQNLNVQGLILVGYEIDKDFILHIREKGMPLVLVDNDLWDEKVDCIVNDNIYGARNMVNYLIKLGHKKIGFIGGPLSHLSLDERYMGYKQALKQAGIEKDNNLITFCDPYFWIDDGYEATKKLLDEQEVTAIFAANDQLAIGAMKAIQERGLKVPDDISVAGFDDINLSQHTVPALTTVRVFKEEMGIEAAKRLVDLMEGVTPKPIKIVVSVELVIRDSVALRK